MDISMKHIRIYILIGLCMTAVRAAAFGYELHVPIQSSHSYGTSYRHSTPGYTMQSTSSARMSSTCRTSDDLAVLGNSSGRFTTCLYGVGEEFTSSSGAPRPRRVGENQSSEDPGPDKLSPVGDLSLGGLMGMVLLYGGYIALHKRRKSR